MNGNRHRRRYKEIRERILDCLKEKPKSITRIAKETNTTWRTTKKQLEHLRKKLKVLMYVNEPRIKMYKLNLVTKNMKK